MKYTAVVATAEQTGKLGNYLLDQLTIHFRSWASEVFEPKYSLIWVKDTLMFSTDSVYLLHKWLAVERKYVNHLLDEANYQSAVLSEDWYEFAA